MSRLPVHSLQPFTRPPQVWARLAALYWLCLFSLPVIAQYRFDHWTTEDGLPQNAINAITQTRDGYLWLATNDGLARFDGLRFTIFKRGNTPGLESNRLLSLYEDRQGTLWVGSAESTLTRYRDGRFTSYTTKDGLPEDQFKKIEEDAAGRLWLTGAARGNIIEWREGRFLIYRAQDCLPGRIAAGSDLKQIWWSLNEAGLHFISRGRLFTFTQQDGLPSLKINSVVEDQYGTLWVDANGGLVRIKQGQVTVLRWPHFHPPRRSGAPFGEDRKGNLWIFSGENAQRINAGTLTAQPEIRGFGTAFYEDLEGTVWIGTTEGLYRARALPIRMLTERPHDRYQLTTWIYSVLEDRNGDVWLGQWGGGLSRYRAGRFTHFVSGAAWRATLSKMKQQRADQLYNLVYAEELFSPRITSLYEDRAGVLWVGTDSGMCQFKDGKLTRYSSAQNLSEVWATYQDRAGDYWFASTTGLTNLHDGGFTTYTTRNGLPHNDAKVILEDRRGRLWIGTYGGLTRWERGRFSAWTEQDGLAGKQIRCLYEDSDGALWIGTYDGGLTRLKDGRFQRYTPREGLFADSVFQILDDGRGYFWLSCNRGIFRVSQQQLNDLAEGRSNSIHSTAFDAKDGMLKAECNGGGQPAGWKLRNGQLWFPTVQGVAIIDPDEMPLNPLPPPLVIEGCRLDNDEVACRQELRIPPGKEYLEIRYTGLSFIKSEQIKFAYRLAGRDRDWVAANNRRSAYYDHLPPGSYLFTVRAANSDGVWNIEGQSLKIVVEPRWWQRWQVRWLALFIAAAIIALSYRQRSLRLKREQQQREETLRRERALNEAFSRKLLASQENERAEIARALHDVLKPKLEEIKRQSTRARQPAQEQVNESIARIAAETDRAMEDIAEIIRGVRPPILEAGLTEALKAIVRRAAYAPRLGVLDEVGQVDKLLPEHLEAHLYYLVQEAMLNIHRHAQATEARVTVCREADRLLVIIQDNGCGYDAEKVAVSRARGGSFGLTSITERAHILGGAPVITTAPGQGTTITLKLKLAEEHHDP